MVDLKPNNDQQEFRCSHCRGKILVPKNLPPTTAACPHCQKEITSPGPQLDLSDDPIFGKPIQSTAPVGPAAPVPLLKPSGGPPPLPKVDPSVVRAELEQAEREKSEAVRLAKEAEDAARFEAEMAEVARLEAARAEEIRLAREMAEARRLESEAADKERFEAERKEVERLAAETARIDEDRAAVEKAELERIRAEEARRLQAERDEIERIREEKSRLEAERLEAEKLAAEATEKARIAREEAMRIEAGIAAAAEAAEKARIEEEARRARELAERAAAEKAERERIEAERQEAERVAAEAAEKARQEQEAAEKIRLEEEARRARDEAERLEAERLAVEKAEKARREEEAEKAKREAERIAAETAERERLEAERLAAAAVEKARLEEEAREAREEAERIKEEKSRLEEEARAAKAEAERIKEEKARLEAEIAEKARLEEEARQAREEAERVAAEKAEKDRIEAERLAKEEAQLREAERIQAEKDRVAREEREKHHAREAEAARIEAERVAAERREVERAEALRLESVRIQSEADRIAEQDREHQEARRAEEAREALERKRAEELEQLRRKTGPAPETTGPEQDRKPQPVDYFSGGTGDTARIEVSVPVPVTRNPLPEPEIMTRASDVPGLIEDRVKLVPLIPHDPRRIETPKVISKPVVEAALPETVPVEPPAKHEVVSPFGPTGPETAVRDEVPKKRRSKVPALTLLVLLALAGGAYYLVSQKLRTKPPLVAMDAARAGAVREEQYLESGWEEDARSQLRDFLAATGAAGKAARSIRGSELLAEMEEFYGSGLIDDSDTPESAFSVFPLSIEDRKRGIFMLVYDQPPVFELGEFFTPLSPLDVQYSLREPDMLLSTVARMNNFTAEPLRVHALFKRTPEGLKLDWETFVQTKYRSLRSFLELPEAGKKGIFRVFILETVPERGRSPVGTRTYQIFDPAQREDSERVNVPVDSDIGQALSILNWRGTKQARATARTATVELEWTDTETPRLKISRFICWEFLGVGGEAVGAGK